MGYVDGMDFLLYLGSAPLQGVDSMGLSGGGGFAMLQKLKKESEDVWEPQVGADSASTGYRAAVAAFKNAALSGFSGLHGGEQDAYRHCLWSCLMGISIGVEDAETIGTLHEMNDWTYLLSGMDLKNNKEGRKCAEGIEDHWYKPASLMGLECVECCEGKLLSDPKELEVLTPEVVAVVTAGLVKGGGPPGGVPGGGRLPGPGANSAQQNY